MGVTMDSPAGVLDIVSEAHSFYRLSSDHWSGWRREAETAFAMRAGDQWDKASKREIEERQRKPTAVFNRIGVTLRAIVGHLVNNRHEIRCIPVEIGDAAVNDVLTGALRWVREGTDADHQEIEAFHDLVTCGMGCVETYLDNTREMTGEIRVARISPLEVYPDPGARLPNCEDGRRILRLRVIERAAIKELYPRATLDSDAAPWASELDRKGKVDGGAVGASREYFGDPTVTDRTREEMERLVVAHYQTMRMRPVWVTMDPLTGEAVELTDEEMFQATAAAGGVPPMAVQRLQRYVHEAVICGSEVLKDGPAIEPESFSYQIMTGLWDEAGRCWYGLVRDMADPQRWANKMVTEMLRHYTRTAKGGWFVLRHGVENVAQFEESVARDDVVTFLEQLDAVRPKDVTPIPPALPTVAEHAVAALRDTSGVSVEALGMADRMQAGVLEEQRTRQSLSTLAMFFNALRLARRQMGRLHIALIREYLPPDQLVRISEAGSDKWVPLALARATARYDVIVDEAPHSPDQRWRVFQMVTQLLPGLLQAGIPIPPDLLEYLPLPQSLAAKWKEMLTQPPAPPSPEQQAQLARVQADTGLKESAALLNTVKAQATAMDARVNAAATLIGPQNLPSIPTQPISP